VPDIRVIAAEDVGEDAEAFFSEFGGEPVIVTGVRDHLAGLSWISPEELEEWFEGETVTAVEAESQERVELAGEEFFAGIKRGETRYNMVDHTVVDTTLGHSLEVPSFLSQNWLADPDEEEQELRNYEKSLVATAARGYTPAHRHEYGFSGWMYLIYGLKEWVFHHPRYSQALYDPMFREFYDERAAAARPEEYLRRFPLAELVASYRVEGSIGAGDLLVYPGGWIHSVHTLEESFGYGGAVLNGHSVENAMRCWLLERSLGMAGSLDLKAFLKRKRERLWGVKAPEEPAAACRDRDLDRVEEALALCEEWEARFGGTSPHSSSHD